MGCRAARFAPSSHDEACAGPPLPTHEQTQQIGTTRLY